MPIKVKLTNRTTTLYPPFPTELIDKLTSFSIPNVYFMPGYNKFHTVRKMVDGKWRLVQERIWDGRKHLFDKKNNVLPTGLWLSIQDALRDEGHFYLPQDCSDARRHPSAWYREAKRSYPELKLLLQQRFPIARHYQIDAAIAMIREAVTGGLILQATGSGKTLLAGMVFALLWDVECLFVVDELTLLHQARKELKDIAGEEIGFVGEGEYKIHRITVATIQTLDLHKHDPKFMQWLEGVNILVLDEIHVQMAMRNFSVIEALRPAAVFGLTATLEMKKKHIRLRAQALCGPVLYEYPYAQGVKEEFLAKGAVVRVIVEKQAAIHKGMLWYQYDYHKHIGNSKRRNTIVGLLARESLMADRRVIVLVERVAHLQRITKRLANCNPATVWGGKKSKERIRTQSKFEKGELRLIIANKVFEKGVNIKSVDTGIDASASKSPNKAMQKFGRFVRLCKGKKYALFFDISDKGNRFEEAANIRFRTFKKNKIPVVTVRAPDDLTDRAGFRLWFNKIVLDVERVLKVE